MSEKKKILALFYKNFVSFEDFIRKFYSRPKELESFPIILKDEENYIFFRTIGHVNLSVQYKKKDDTWEELGWISDH